MSESGIWLPAQAVRNAVSQLTVPGSVLSSPIVVQAKELGSEFGSPTRGEETKGRQLAASGDNSCEQCTAVTRGTHANTFACGSSGGLPCSLHCFVSFRTTVILTNSFHVPRAMHMASPHFFCQRRTALHLCSFAVRNMAFSLAVLPNSAP